MNPNQPHTLPPSYFDDVYRANADPWGFEVKPYEREKYDATLAALPRPRYRSAFEIGCSIGVLTARLAERCDHLLAVDGSVLPLERARERCRHLPQVEIAQMVVPEQFPAGPFDLILVSEVGYYWEPDDLRKAQELMLERLEPGGHLELVHWTPWVHDYPLTGDEVHESFLALAAEGGPLRRVSGSRAENYRLDVYERTDAPAGP